MPFRSFWATLYTDKHPPNSPLPARGVYEDSTALNRRAPNDAPKLRSRDPNKPPAFRNSARLHSQAGRVRDPSRYTFEKSAKIMFQNIQMKNDLRRIERRGEIKPAVRISTPIQTICPFAQIYYMLWYSRNALSQQNLYWYPTTK